MDAPPNRGSFNSAHIFGTHVPVEEPSTASIPDGADARRIMQIVLGDHSVEFETKHWNLDKVCWFCPIGFSQFLMRKGEIPTRV
jgi:hypothetical protein